jgi:uncharacterized lipoprotein YddW (UPF0748 family)
MIKRSICSALLLMYLAPVPACALPPAPPHTPKSEVRAVWITTASGLDWPRVTGRQNQQESLRRLVRDLHAAHFNTLFFQVRPRGDAYYHSHYEPWAEALSGTLGKDPEWDPLSTLIDEAHALGMEVHGWFNVFKVRGPNPVAATTPPHISRSHHEWTVERDGELWLNPGIPEVRTFVLNVALDLIKEYDLDGINFDYIRYPGQFFPDQDLFEKYGNGMKREDWRRSNVTAFVSAFAAEARKIRPQLKIGSSPLGVYRDDSNNDRRGGYYWVYQDSYTWLERGWHDYLAPQNYWVIGRERNSNPDFMRVTKQWTALTAGRHIYMGIGAYRSEIKSRITEYVDSTRTTGMLGQVYFRWTDIANSSALVGKYATIALIPAMRWRDSIPSLPPQNVRVTNSQPAGRKVAWDAPPTAADGDIAHTYVVYRWSSRFIPFADPHAIVTVLPASQREYTDTTARGNGAEFYYSVTSRDRMGNESAPSAIREAGGK